MGYEPVTELDGWTDGILTGRSTISGLDLAWFSSLSSKHLCVFMVFSAILIHPSLYLLVS